MYKDGSKTKTFKASPLENNNCFWNEVFRLYMIYGFSWTSNYTSLLVEVCKIISLNWKNHYVKYVGLHCQSNDNDNATECHVTTDSCIIEISRNSATQTQHQNCYLLIVKQRIFSFSLYIFPVFVIRNFHFYVVRPVCTLSLSDYRNLSVKFMEWYPVGFTLFPNPLFSPCRK